MKQFLLAAAFVCGAIANGNARIVTTQTNGNATNPFTWDCTCIPVNGDTIVINHALTLDVDYAFTLGAVQVNATGSVTGNSVSRIFGVSGGYFLNNGIVSVAYVYHNGGTFTNNGTITVTRNCGVDQAVTLVNNASFNVNDTMLVNGAATFQNPGSFYCPEVLSTGTIANTGTFDADNVYSSGTFTHTGGLLQMNMSIYNSGVMTITGSSVIPQDVFNAGDFTLNSYMSVRNLYNGDSISGTATFTNNATMSISEDLWNSETINGTGNFCVSDTTANSGTISGTLDICDQSGGNIDYNVGTIAGTVTYCSSGPCTIGMEEHAVQPLSVMPNPASDFITVQLPYAASGIVRVTDVTGKVVSEIQIVNRAQVNVSGFAPGMYSVIVVTDEELWSERVVVE
jgi:hypothetical protein